MISKPVVPPWNDSSKNLVRDVVLGTAQARFCVLTDGRGVFAAPHIEERALYRGAGGFAPRVLQNARALLLLVRPGRVDVQHFFFAPNLRTSRIIRAVRRLRRPPAVHTVCSVPRHFGGVSRLLFAEVTVAVSRYTRDRLLEAGVSGVRAIAPAAPPLEPRLAPADRARARARFGLGEVGDEGPVVVFPGDYEFGDTAERLAEVAWRLREQRPAPRWVFACRLKTPAAVAVERRVKARLAPLAERGQVRFLNQVDDILELLTAADLVALPATTTYAKMDLPLVLLEAMALGRPILVSDRPPLSELPVPEAGFSVPPDEVARMVEVVEAALADPEELARRGARAAALARERYGRERMASEYLAIYRDLL